MSGHACCRSARLTLEGDDYRDHFLLVIFIFTAGRVVGITLWAMKRVLNQVAMRSSDKKLEPEADLAVEGSMDAETY